MTPRSWDLVDYNKSYSILKLGYFEEISDKYYKGITRGKCDQNCQFFNIFSCNFLNIQAILVTLSHMMLHVVFFQFWSSD